MHIEHIYPQTPAGSQKWANHSAMINRIGGLTLLGKRFNTSIKNADFETKKEKAYKDSDILMTKELLGRDDWPPEAVNERQDELSKWVFEIWRFPGESAPVEEAQPAAAADDGTGTTVEEAPEHLPEVPSG